MTNDHPVYLSSLLSLHAPLHLSSSHTDPLGVHLNPSLLFALAFSVPSDRNAMSLLNYLVTSYSISSSCTCSGKPSVSSLGQLLSSSLHPSTSFWHPSIAIIIALMSLPSHPEGPQGQGMCSHVCSHRREKERRWERKRRERREGGSRRWLVGPQHPFPTSLTSCEGITFPCSQSWCQGVIDPTLKSGPEWPKEITVFQVSGYRWVQIWVYNPVRDIFWVFRERQASFYKRYQRHFPLPDWYE